MVRPPPPTLFADGDGPRKEADGNVILRVGFFDEVGEVVDGLMSCPESLGFESSYERRVDDERMGDDDRGDSDPKPCILSRVKRRDERQRITERKFPRTLTSWNNKGRPSFFLNLMRRHGRLELTEVRIERPEILPSLRGNGRLRLEFFKGPEFEADNKEMWTKDVTDENEAEEEEPKASIPREGLERCHDALDAVGSHRGSGHDNHNLHVWRQRCVTNR